MTVKLQNTKDKEQNLKSPQRQNGVNKAQGIFISNARSWEVTEQTLHSAQRKLLPAQKSTLKLLVPGLKLALVPFQTPDNMHPRRQQVITPVVRSL